MKKLSLFIVASLILFSCKKEPITNQDRYLIFNSDSTNVFGMFLDDSTKIYPNTAYKVLDGRTILFDRPCDTTVTNHFKLNIDLGPDNYFSINNIHYSLVNDYIFTIK